MANIGVCTGRPLGSLLFNSALARLPRRDGPLVSSLQRCNFDFWWIFPKSPRVELRCARLAVVSGREGTGGRAGSSPDAQWMQWNVLCKELRPRRRSKAT